MARKLGNGTTEYWELKERIEEISDLPLEDRDEARRQLRNEINSRYGDDPDAKYLKDTYLR